MPDAPPPSAVRCQTAALVESNLIALSGALGLIALALLLVGFLSTEPGLVIASMVVSLMALVPLGLGVLRSQVSRGRHRRQ